MNRKLLVALAGISLSAFAVSAANAATYKLDFGPDGSPATAGYVTTATSSIPFNSITSPTYDLGGGAALSFTSVNNYNLGNADNPLVTDGLFVNSAAPAGNFTISGLDEGDLVTLYAINAWDGAGRAAFVSLDGGSYVDSGGGHDYTSASGQPG